MGSPGTCPRGHALEENAVYCTVCWVRVEPEDAGVVAARRRRQRRIWLPMLVVSAILVGVAIGGSAGLFGGRTASTSVVAAGATATVAASIAPADASTAPTTADTASAPATAVTASAPAETPSAPASVAVPPMAATAPDIRICVPADTRSLVVRARVGTEGGWQVLSSDATIGGTGDCSPAEVAAGISLPGLPTGLTKLKAVARDAAGVKLARIQLDPSDL